LSRAKIGRTLELALELRLPKAKGRKRRRGRRLRKKRTRMGEKESSALFPPICFTIIIGDPFSKKSTQTRK